MEQKIPLHPISLNSSNRPHPFSNIEPNYPWVRHVVGVAAVTSIFGIVVLILTLAFPISMLVIGVRYRHFLYCPIEPRLSLFLIVAGSFSIIWIVVTIVLSLLTMFLAYKRSMISMIFVGILSVLILAGQIFSLIWLIVGSVWTFSIRNRVQHIINYPYNLPVYCDKTLYQFTFAYLIIIYVLLGIQICCRCCLHALSSRQQK